MITPIVYIRRLFILIVYTFFYSNKSHNKSVSGDHVWRLPPPPFLSPGCATAVYLLSLTSGSFIIARVLPLVCWSPSAGPVSRVLAAGRLWSRMLVSGVGSRHAGPVSRVLAAGCWAPLVSCVGSRHAGHSARHPSRLH